MGSELEQALETMDAAQILDALGIDLSDADARKGAVEAIAAILDSRKPPMKLDLGMDLGGTQDVDIDPDLIQPSAKFDAEESDADIEIQDDEDILSQVKRNDSEDDIESSSSNSANNSNGSDGDSTDGSDEEFEDEDYSDSQGGSDNPDENNDPEEPSDDSSSSSSDSDSDSDLDSSSSSSAPKHGDVDDAQQSDRITKNTDSASDTGSKSKDTEESDDDTTQKDSDDAGAPNTDDADSANIEPDELSDTEDAPSDDGDDLEDDNFEDFDFDESDLLDTEDGEYQNITDKSIADKTNARIIKRQRTLDTAKATLAKAIQNKASAALISELEKSIAALEELTEATDLSMRSMSDEAFNQRINRVLDAIEALGNSGLVFSTDEERQLQAKEIKDDIEATKHELSREDAEQIRAERQVIKAREKEAARYSTKSRNSFKGFQDFLNNLYRAVALQVKTIEVRNDTWSAISRRNSGKGVLRQGQRIEELPEAKIPVIDFYFDQSGSWDAKELSFGKKAVQALADMESKGQIKVNVYYFANWVSANPDDWIGGGTSAWNEIVKNIIQTKATNVVIMTDSDMEDQWGGGDALKYTVPGYVWYLWKNGVNAPRLPRDLNGRAGTQQFAFNCR